MPKIILSTFASSILTAAIACTPPPTQEEKAVPKVEQKKEAPPAPAPQKKAAVLPEGAVALNGDITFVGRKVVGSHDFIFKTWTGYAKLKDQQVAGGTIGFQIDTASVVADPENRSKWTPKLEKHMKDPDFFHVDQFPTATFLSSNIAADAKGAADTYTISGKLMIKGISKEITFPAIITLENGKPSASATVTINRQDFNIKYPGKPDNLIQDDVVITIKAKG